MLSYKLDFTSLRDYAGFWQIQSHICTRFYHNNVKCVSFRNRFHHINDVYHFVHVQTHRYVCTNLSHRYMHG